MRITIEIDDCIIEEFPVPVEIVTSLLRVKTLKQALEKKLELVTAQHDALVKNNADLCDLVKKREWISVAEELPPRHREVLVFTHEKEFFVDARTHDMVEYSNWASHWRHLPEPSEIM